MQPPKRQTTIEEFYFGNLDPNEQMKAFDPEYDECSRYALKNEEELLAKLNDEEKALCQNLMENRGSSYTMEVRQAFVNSFKIGSLLMMEVLVEKEKLSDW